jgi:hypothetical protein
MVLIRDLAADSCCEATVNCVSLLFYEPTMSLRVTDLTLIGKLTQRQIISIFCSFTAIGDFLPTDLSWFSCNNSSVGIPTNFQLCFPSRALSLLLRVKEINLCSGTNLHEKTIHWIALIQDLEATVLLQDWEATVELAIWIERPLLLLDPD